MNCAIGKRQTRCLMVVALALVAMLSLAPLANAQAGGQPYIGEIIAVGFNFAPNGWAYCDGSILPISENDALFALIGTTFGGDGQQTFALPDLRGRSALGQGQGLGLSPYVIGQTGGQEQVTVLVSQLPAHTHPAFGSTSAGNLASPSNAVWATQTRSLIFSSAQNTPMAPGAVAISGGNQPHDNRSPYLAMNYIISLFGIFPTRN